MERVRAAGSCGVDDARDGEITLGGRCRANRDGAIGGGDMRRERIGFRVHGDRLDAELAAGANDPQRDFAVIAAAGVLPALLLGRRSTARAAEDTTARAQPAGVAPATSD